MRQILFAILAIFFSAPAYTQEVIPLENIHGLHSAYVIPLEGRSRVDVQLIVLSGSNDETELSGIAHYTEHLAALWSDQKILREARQRDLNAFTSDVSTVYTNKGSPAELDQVMALARAVLETPKLDEDFMATEIDIVKREIYFRERANPINWLARRAQQILYGSQYGRAGNDVEDLNRLSIDAALEFHKEHYQPSNVLVIISGKIDQETAQAALTRHFGDTKKTEQVKDIWLDQHPEADLRAVEVITTPSVARDIVTYVKFFEFPDPQDILAMQASFFIASDIYGERLQDALYYNSFKIHSYSQRSYIAIDGDLEYTAFVAPADGVSNQEALEELEKAIASIRAEDITEEEISIARQRNVAYTRRLSQSPRAYLDFFQNLGSDGLPPTSPSQFAQMVADASDDEVRHILAAFAADSPSAAVLASAKGAE